MKRRDFITFLGGATAWPIAARAQQPRRIGVLMTIAPTDPEAPLRIGALRQGLQKLGWVEGRNVQIDYRWPGADPQFTLTYAAQLVDLMPDVLLAHSQQGVAALMHETHTIPIVFVQIADPVSAGLVPSLANPGGNVTGFVHFEPLMSGKWLEILNEVVPGLTQALVIQNPETSAGYLRAIEAAASSRGVRLTAASVSNAVEIERAFDTFVPQQTGGLIVLPDPVAAVYRERIVALAARHRLPAVYPLRFFVASGGLISYGINNYEQWRQAASYLDRLLKGSRPSDLPIQLPTRFELIVNLKAAKALGLTIPESFLARADEVIE
jgi:putative tryptophan/tyrosine transport system substrate-binding protein